MFKDLLFAVLTTAFAYMAFPVTLILIKRKRFDVKTAKTIALFNSIILGLIFIIVTAEQSNGSVQWNSFPAVLYYWINQLVLTKKDKGQQYNNGNTAYVQPTPSIDPIQEEINNLNKLCKKIKRAKIIRSIIAILAIAIILFAIQYVIADKNQADYHVDKYGNITELNISAEQIAKMIAISILFAGAYFMVNSIVFGKLSKLSQSENKTLEEIRTAIDDLSRQRW